MPNEDVAAKLQARPDAVDAPESLRGTGTAIDRIDNILAVAEPLLGVDRPKGERGYVRRQPEKRLFITRDPNDTIYFAKGHDLEGRSRYRWEDSATPDVRVGYLVDGA